MMMEEWGGGFSYFWSLPYICIMVTGQILVPACKLNVQNKKKNEKISF